MDQLKHFKKFTGGNKMDACVPKSWQCKQIVNKPRRYPIKQVKIDPIILTAAIMMRVYMCEIQLPSKPCNAAVCK